MGPAVFGKIAVFGRERNGNNYETRGRSIRQEKK